QFERRLAAAAANVEDPLPGPDRRTVHGPLAEDDELMLHLLVLLEPALALLAVPLLNLSCVGKSAHLLFPFLSKTSVIPAKAGIQRNFTCKARRLLDSRLRGNDI